MTVSSRVFAAFLAVLVLAATACAGGGDASSRPTVVVTTNILGDVVSRLVGDQVDVITIMPIGADPHAFQASAQQVARIGDADVLIANGGGFEQGLVDVIEAAVADGVPTFEAVSAVEPLELGEAGHDESDDADDHDHGSVDPHFFTDPARMAVAARAIADFVGATVDGVDPDALAATVEAYTAELVALDAEVAAMLAPIPDEARVLITNHEVFGYFADRYHFEIVGTVFPGGSTADGADAQRLVELTEVVQRERVPAVFVDSSSTAELAHTLAAEVGDIAIVELFSESLGAADSDGATYLEMVRSNARRIARALAGSESDR